MNFSVILTLLEMLLALLASAVAWPEAPTACEVGRAPPENDQLTLLSRRGRVGISSTPSYNKWFPIRSGVAQGCPLSPLLFLVVGQALKIRSAAAQMLEPDASTPAHPKLAGPAVRFSPVFFRPSTREPGRRAGMCSKAL